MPEDVLFASAYVPKIDAQSSLPAKFGRMLERLPLSEIVKDKSVAHTAARVSREAAAVVQVWAVS